mmetsp:Transcript_10147/g.24370  ORF Transcript_10147/g.24370 Transcript_10147/m.24370 type:complete len:131 (+) Transcript_10147:2-394(+)
MASASGEALAKVEVEDLLEAMDTFVPTIPEEVIQHYLRQTGFQTSDERLIKLVSLAAQKFATDVIQDSLQRSKWRREASRGKERTDDRRYTLSTEDVTEALREQGVYVAKPVFFADREADAPVVPSQPNE